MQTSGASFVRDSRASRGGSTQTPTVAPAFIVDAFSEVPFGGNPAAVCLIDTDLPVARMLAIAREFAFSETAFVRRGGGNYQLRWFTPTGEVALCGHATLAAAAVLWVHGGVIPGKAIHFDTLSGPLTARRSADGITIELPRMELIATTLPTDTADALGIDAVACFQTPMRGGIEDWDYLIPLSSETAVRQLVPDDRALARTRAGVIVTAPADDTRRFDFVSRYFAPFWGIPEDSVTGSAHCALAPYWGRRLKRRELRAYQASKRGGAIEVRLGKSTVQLTGRATIVMRGDLSL